MKNRFKKGSIGTKLSFFIMGSGNIYHKQYVKGLIFFLIQIFFILYMVSSFQVNNTPLGYKSLLNLFTLGTNPGDEFTLADDSRLMLLFGVITIGIIILYFLAYFYNIKSSYKADEDVRKNKKPTSIKEDIKNLLDGNFHILLLTPTCIAVLIFTILPTIFMILIAFTNYGDTSMNDDRVATYFNWIGFDNFKDIFLQGTEISHFGSVLLWTIIWATFATFSCYFGGIFLALLINKKEIKFKKLWRTIFILTIATPQFISLLAVRNLLANQGPFNQLLLDLNLISTPIEFLGADAANPTLTKISVLIINMWIGIPYTMLMTSGILLNIPKDLYEAAKIDGASKFKMFEKITLPYILFVTGPYLISSFVGNITSFNVIYLLTGGGPKIVGSKAGATDLLVTWLYKLTIDEGIYNVGSVISILTFVITASITLIAYRKSKSYKQEDAFQ